MPTSNYFVEIQGDLIPVPDIERASYSDDPECSAPPYLVIWMKPQPAQMLSATHPKYEYWGEHAEQGLKALRAVQLPHATVDKALLQHLRSVDTSANWKATGVDKASLQTQVAQVGEQLQRLLAKAEPDFCPGTKDGQHEWQDPAKNTVVSCKACGKIQP